PVDGEGPGGGVDRRRGFGVQHRPVVACVVLARRQPAVACGATPTHEPSGALGHGCPLARPRSAQGTARWPAVAVPRRGATAAGGTTRPARPSPVERGGRNRGQRTSGADGAG